MNIYMSLYYLSDNIPNLVIIANRCHMNAAYTAYTVKKKGNKHHHRKGVLIVPNSTWAQLTKQSPDIAYTYWSHTYIY